MRKPPSNKEETFIFFVLKTRL